MLIFCNLQVVSCLTSGHTESSLISVAFLHRALGCAADSLQRPVFWQRNLRGNSCWGATLVRGPGIGPDWRHPLARMAGRRPPDGVRPATAARAEGLAGGRVGTG